MNEKILDSTHQGITTSSSHQSSMNGNNFFKLGWENGEIVVKRSSSNITQQNNPSCKKLEEDFAMIKQEKVSMHDEFLDSSTSFKKQVIDHSSQAPQENSKKLKYLRNCDQRKVKVINNFSNFLVPKVFPKSTTQPIRNEETFAKIEEIEVAKGSKGIKGYEKLSLDDENSEAEAILRAKGKAKSSLLCDEPLSSSSPIWSIEASNDPKITKYEDTDESTYSTRDNDEETEDVLVKETPPQEGNSLKRKETNNLCEKNHRDIMNKKMRILKELIPNCNKVDKASLLDDAIDYVKSLKLQLQIMSVGNGLCMPQMMLPQLMGSGMGFSFRPWTPHQLPIPSLSITKDNNTLQNMFGSFSNHMLQIPTLPHHVPNFMPMMIANNSSLTTPNVSDLHAKAELCDTNNHAPFNHIPSYYPF